ncbi:MAG: hypothetical protein LBJ16_04240 [Holosporaceae bacterium]|jgi:hypothetical protein|nr:hypothetical protein [Holosporaceae bacterium]
MGKIAFATVFLTYFGLHSMQVTVPVGYSVNNIDSTLSRMDEKDFFKASLLDQGLDEDSSEDLASIASKEVCSLDRKKVQEAGMASLAKLYGFDMDRRARLWDMGGVLFGALRNITYGIGILGGGALSAEALLDLGQDVPWFGRMMTCAMAGSLAVGTVCDKVSSYFYGRRDERRAMLLYDKGHHRNGSSGNGGIIRSNDEAEKGLGVENMDRGTRETVLEVTNTPGGHSFCRVKRTYSRLNLGMNNVVTVETPLLSKVDE